MTSALTIPADVWTYDAFQPGYLFGETQFRIAADRVARWQEIYGGAEENVAPPGLLVVEMMKAYLDLVHPRPPGNIHAGQKLEFLDMEAPSDAVFTARVSCKEKTRRKDRGWVTFDVILSARDCDVLRGEIVTIWAS